VPPLVSTFCLVHEVQHVVASAFNRSRQTAFCTNARSVHYQPRAAAALARQPHAAVRICEVRSKCEALKRARNLSVPLSWHLLALRLTPGPPTQRAAPVGWTQ